jgi:hypothetical protein
MGRLRRDVKSWAASLRSARHDLRTRDTPECASEAPGRLPAALVYAGFSRTGAVALTYKAASANA